MLQHHYGPQVNISSNSFLLFQLSKLCSPNCQQPEFNHLITFLYKQMMIWAVDQFFSTYQEEIETRMTKTHPEKFLSINKFTEQNITIINLLRAGALPSYACFDILNDMIDSRLIKIDTIMAERIVNENNQVIGTDFKASKISNLFNNEILLIPDPMGATGGSICSTIDFYLNKSKSIKEIIVLHLITTPEYLKKVLNHYPKIKIFTLRVDRGMSSTDVLNSPLGKHWDKEFGLDHSQYIVPGAGGVGELMHNCFN